MVKTRTSIDKKRAEIKKPFLDVGKGIDDYAKKLTAMFADVENTLKLENDKVKQWEKEAEEKKEAERQAKIKARVAELTTAGITFNWELYVIGDTISVDIGTIEKMENLWFMEKKWFTACRFFKMSGICVFLLLILCRWMKLD